MDAVFGQAIAGFPRSESGISSNDAVKMQFDFPINYAASPFDKAIGLMVRFPQAFDFFQ
jgi:hypothetical protein